MAALRLTALLADREDLAARADAAAGTLRGLVEAAPRFAGWAFADALIEDRSDRGLTRAVAAIVAPEGQPLAELTRAAARMAPAGTALVAGPEGTAGFAHHFDARAARDGEATAYVCRGTVCFAPATTIPELYRALWTTV